MAKSKSKATKKEEPKDVKTGSMGIGDAFAYGVKELLGDARASKPSQGPFLGVDKIEIDVKDCVDPLKLNYKGQE